MFRAPGSTYFSEIDLIIVFIEILSYNFRVVSLSVRLFANMVAGHILLELITDTACTLGCAEVDDIPYFLAPISVGIVTILLFVIGCFEVFVCAIQGYIFCLLCHLYVDESETLDEGH